MLASSIFGFLSTQDYTCTTDTFSCEDDVPCKLSKGFDFPILWNITSNYFYQCNTSGKWLFPNPTGSIEYAALTHTACEAIAGAGARNYPGADVWSRLTLWKFPLLQLLANSPRPPLGFIPELFVVVHLFGDPIGSITDIIWKIESCQSRAVYWQQQVLEPPCVGIEYGDERWQARLWKALAIITNSYDEWGYQIEDSARRALEREIKRRRDSLRLQASPTEQDLKRWKNFCNNCFTTAGALAADRSTRFGGVSTALSLFIATFVIAIIRTKSAANSDNPTVFANIEIHSIAFSMLYFWLIPAALLTSVVGASQTADAIPRILKRFKRDLKHVRIELDLPRDKLRRPELQKQRLVSGGIYTWRPMRRKQWAKIAEAVKDRKTFIRNHARNAGSTGIRIWELKCWLLDIWLLMHALFPTLIVGIAVLMGIVMSYYVPPKGWLLLCRPGGEIFFLFGWIGSYILTWSIEQIRKDKPVAFKCCPSIPVQLWCLLLKDLAATGASIFWILKTQFGVFNKCYCYTQGGKTGLALLEQPNTKQILLEGLQSGGSYSMILIWGLVAQAVIILLLAWRYSSAYRVFMQTDDGSRNIEWVHKLGDKMRGVSNENRHGDVELEDDSSQGERSPGIALSGQDDIELNSMNDYQEIVQPPEPSHSSNSFISNQEQQTLIQHPRNEESSDNVNREILDARSSNSTRLSIGNQQFAWSPTYASDGRYSHSHGHEQFEDRSIVAINSRDSRRSNTYLAPPPRNMSHRPGYRHESSDEERADHETVERNPNRA